MSVPPGWESLDPEAKRALLAQLLRQKADARVFPLSYGQEALWFLYQLAPESASYNVSFTARLHSRPDVGALERAFGAVTARHEMLRATFEAVGKEPVQRIQDQAVARIEERTATSSGLMQALTEVYKRPFDLAKGPLFRLALVHDEDGSCVLLLVIHHIVFDGSSMGVLLEDWFRCYTAEAAGRPLALPPLGTRYSDFVRWQAELLQSPAGEEMWAYWQGQLKAPLPSVELPLDHPRPAVQTFRGATHTFHIDAAVAQPLRDLARQRGATLYATLLAAFQVLLHRYTDQHDIVVGSPTAGRSRSDFEGLVGYFVNPVVLRGDLSGDPTFLACIDRAREVVVEALRNADYSFPLLVKRLRPERDPSRSPLFQVEFNLVKAGQLRFAMSDEGGVPSRFSMGGLEMTPFAMDQQEGQFDFGFEALDSGRSLLATFKYATDLFERGTIERMAGHLTRLLEGIVSSPESRISELSLLSRGEEEQLSVWNMAAGEYPEVCVHELIVARAKKSPSRVAVEMDGSRLLFGELEERSRALSEHLIGLGVGADVLVGIYMERSLDMVVGLLAILRAGGAYVPLDPAYPRDRLTYMLEDSGARVLVTQQSLLGAFGENGLRAVCVDGDWGAPGSEPRRPATRGSLAYVIYTSGSTGRPKGVAISHRSLVNLLVSMGAEPGLGEDDVLLSVTTLSFDIAGLELYLPLMVGARLVLVSRETAADGPALTERLASSGANVMQATPATWRLLVESGWTGTPGLKVLCGGEALPRDLATDLLTRAAEVWNVYGPTETTIWSSAWKVTSAEGPIPIGRPIANTGLYILDRGLNPVPVGVPGELFIGGHGLARGYWNRPELTAEKFLPDPFSSDRDARMYRTGDLARRLPDGTVDCLGRLDHQVKVRGFRIELGEIEAALDDHPSVRSAVVVAREDVPGLRALVAYVITDEPRERLVGALREWLRERVPEYMVPSPFVFLEAFPLTPNGKIDRKALPAPDHTGVEGGTTAPRTAIEEIVAGIFAEVLQRESVGIEGNFFDLGGHSLLATQMVSRVRKALGVELPLREIFNAPTVAGLASRVEALRGAEDTAPPLVAEPTEGPVELSYAQQRLWFLDQLEPGGSAYVIAGGVGLRGTLDPNALERALGAIVARHEALRTTFASIEGRPVQVVAPPAPWPLAVVDLSREDQPQERAALSMREEARKGFDLARGPLFRPILYRLAPDEQVLLLCMHHIVSDGWSLGVLVHELSTLYEGFVRGEPAGLPPLPVQYRDFSRWQRGWLQGEVLAREVEHWRGRLAGAPHILELPTDHPRPAVGSHRGATSTFLLPRTLSDQLATLSRREGATLFTTLLAGFALFLSRYTGQEDILIGSPVANRNRTEVEGLIGCFVNTLVLRASLVGDPTLRDLLKRLQDETLHAFTHQDLPFEKLVDELRPGRDLGGNPLFQVMLVLQNAPLEPLHLQDLALEPLDVDRGGAQIDLTLYVQDSPDGLRGTFEYATDLFERGTIERMAGHLTRLLEGIVSSPESRISELSLLSRGEEEQLSVWNMAAGEYPEVCVHELIVARAKKSPSRVAVEMDGSRLLFGELEERSRALSEHLIGLGVGADVLVGIYMERSLDMVVGLLAILRAGGAYVPLDPAYPRDRLTYMLEDSGARVLVTQQSLLGAFGENGLRAVCVDGDWGAPGSEPRRPATRGSLAYVIYTSGSTGRPKGVAISHRSLVNLLVSMGAEPGLGEDDVLLSVTTLSFDIAGLELYLPLMVGARLVLVSRETAADGPALTERLASSGANVMQATPATWRLLVESGWTGTPGLKVLCGGEALPRDLATDLLTRAAEVWNVYGPTETTIWSSAWKVTSAEGPIPIGRPIANTGLYILDRGLNPVPVGVPGELFIGGHGLARGYWNRPELTAEKFLPDPFSSDRDARMYRTGDLARRLPDGTVDCLGRLDHQVKVRGFRIELGEIEAALDDHPSVRGAVVVAREDVPGLRALVAYVITDEPRERLVGALREWLRERVPEYMVPSPFVFLEAFPLTPNGKIDRKALPAPDHTGVEGGTTAPRSAIEEIVAGIFAEVLQRESVGIEGNFFDLGGHSLLATQMVSRVRKALGVELPLREIFNAPTVAGLASRVEALRDCGLGGKQPEEPITAEASPGRRELSAIQRRLWFFDRLEPGSSAYNMGFRLVFEGALDPAALERSLGLLVSRHETLRSRFEEEDGEPRVVVLPAAAVRLEVTDLRGSTEAEAEATRIVEGAALAPFDLVKGPLFRARLVRVSETRHVLSLSLHHIVSDGWSVNLLITELLQAYEAVAQGREPPLPALAFQYGDYAAWEARWLEGETAKSQLEYWRRRLAGPLPVVDLPTDHPRPKLQTFRGGVQQGRLSADLSRRLADLSRKEGVTPFMAVLAAFALILNRLTGLDDLPIGVPVAGRNRDGTDRLVGAFINTVVVRYDLQGDPTFADLLLQTRDLALEAYRNADLPFDRVVEALRPRRDPGRTPLFQVLVNSLDFGGWSRFELPGLAVEVQGDAMATSKFDLTLYMGTFEGRMGLALSYNADLFGGARMEELLAQIEHVLEQVTAQPRQRLAEVSLLTPGAQARIPNPLAVLGRSTGPPVLAGLRELAAQQSTKVAVADPHTSLHYAALDRLTGGLAHRLRTAGISRGDVVAIRASRATDLVWGLGGVLRAGAGFVILDSAHPSARLAASIEAARPRAWLESTGLPELGADVRALLDRPGWVLQAKLEPAQVDVAAGPDAGLDHPEAEDLAYVAFTSGTTGGVKGIWGGHGPLAHFLNWHVQTFQLVAEDRFSMISGLSHDPLLRDVFTPIRLGASLHIPDPDDIVAPGRLREWMAREGITVAHLTPAVARLLAEDSTGAELPRLRYAFLGGDVLTRDEVRGLRRVAPAAQIVNFYGATETPQAMGWHLVPAEAEDAPLPLQMPIGQGIDDVQLLVLGKGGRLAGIGEIGEIAVRTPHLAKGYVGDEALTRERFVVSPFSGQPEDRLYRTGDLARFRPDGSVEFAGRADTQVKVRGFRVELGEIEAALRQYPGIEGAAVLAHDVAGGDRRLVAYLSHGVQDQPNVTVLRQHLKTRLPTHMVPSSFVFLDRLPLTPSGKLDRKALMQLEAGQGSGAREVVPPRTPAELFVAGLWRDVLGIDGVSVHDNFFDLGGHSLLAMRVLAAIEKETGLHLHPRVIIFQTLEQIAAACAGALESRPSPGAASESRGIAGRLLGTLRKLVPGTRARPMTHER